MKATSFTKNVVSVLFKFAYVRFNVKIKICLFSMKETSLKCVSSNVFMVVNHVKILTCTNHMNIDYLLCVLAFILPKMKLIQTHLLSFHINMVSFKSVFSNCLHLFN